MKRIYIVAVTVALVFAASSVMAGFPSINTGNSTVNKVVNTGVSTAKNKVIANEINNKIKSYNCAFKNASTTTEMTCDLNKVINDIKSKKAPLEALGLAKVYVNIKAHGNGKTASARGSHVRDVMYGQMNWWRYNVSSVNDSANGLAIWVDVQD